MDIREVAPSVRIEIRYSTPRNFAKRVLYPAGLCLLRKTVALRLNAVQRDLERKRLGLKVWDCYRPLSVQKILWEAFPDENYVAHPKKGSRHNRGAAVDVTLVDAQGRELPMPTDYDDFTERAHRGHAQAPPEQARNAKLLEEAMSAHGFKGLPTEWWHFDALEWESYGLLDVPIAR